MKQMTQRILVASAALITMAGASRAEPVSGKDAAKMVFSPKGAEVEMLPVAGLSSESTALLQQVVKDYAYYAAVAIAPDEDILKSEATMLVANHHSAEAVTRRAKAGRLVWLRPLCAPKTGRPARFSCRSKARLH